MYSKNFNPKKICPLIVKKRIKIDIMNVSALPVDNKQRIKKLFS